MSTLKILLASFLLFSLVACGGSQEDDRPTSVPSSATTSDSPSEDPSPAITKGELSKVVLAVDEMPTGYAKDGKDDDGTPTSHYCDYKPKYEQVMGISRTFNRDDVDIVNASVRVYQSPEIAREAMAQVKSVLDAGCTEQSVDGEKYRFGLVSAPSAGDQSYAVRADIESGGSIVNWYVLRGPAIVSVGGGGYSPMAIDELRPLLDKQIAKFDAALAD